ncbi:MAG TPA: hypothetical protein ENG45_00985 [Candidatus Aenigmarchaeota archaeon]|nr:hypothetical protein [Candidatus Aenigmarchaeota archaeon]
MEERIDTYSWLELLRRVPKKFQPLVRLAMEIESLNERYIEEVEKGIGVLPLELQQQLIDSGQRLVFEYLSLISVVGKDMRNELMNDLRQEYSLLFWEKEEGKGGGLAQKMLYSVVEERQIPRIFRTFITQLVSFVHHRVYDVLVRCIEDMDREFEKQFAQLSLRRAGIFERIEEAEVPSPPPKGGRKK